MRLNYSQPYFAAQGYLAMATSLAKADIEAFSTVELCDFLRNTLSDIAPATLSSFTDNRINGKIFLTLTGEDLKEVVQPLGDRKTLKSIICRYHPKKDNCVSLNS